MSSAISGRAARESIPGPSSSPVAQVSASAIARNAGVALARVPRGFRVTADLRHDAWGHGAAEVAATLRAIGVRELLVDAGQEHTLADEASEATVGETDVTLLDLPTLYGLPGAALGTTPAMRLSGTVLSVKQLRAGEGVSYGYSFRASVDSRVALVSGGYAQGIVRSLGNRAGVALPGARRPIVGRVAMDVCVVDVGDAEVERGDEVVFFGDPAHGEPSLGEWAVSTGLTCPELVTAVGLRAARAVVA